MAVLIYDSMIAILLLHYHILISIYCNIIVSFPIMSYFDNLIIIILYIFSLCYRLGNRHLNQHDSQRVSQQVILHHQQGSQQDSQRASHHHNPLASLADHRDNQQGCRQVSFWALFFLKKNCHVVQPLLLKFEFYQ